MFIIIASVAWSCCLIIYMICHIRATWFRPPINILLILDEMMREDLEEDANAKVFIMWALFRAYFYGESDYMYWKATFMNNKTAVASAVCNPYLLRIHAELDKIIKFYSNDLYERQRIMQIKMHINLYFHFKPTRAAFRR